ncbi:hypothetical protein [Mycolicibacterium litorale]|uniref:Transmembrane protein n=1 Tax=Mycolicibacterium litorale TaxID=758802 RepID=A0AAD1IMG4_9MYCO|nr:hypothetical protein [Mycolicibacterium litorale]MCV7416626.1 hypothetical protein [Mycolicibacterium litorale]TDY09878.1 hypothetical protein BCL50_1983 [Mycolicibacterium litorale]BBY17839.1 hypothetical protein MLIT_34310 [Mycolicibacterium litorale]
MVHLESILRVLVIGLILGAGLPAVFAYGLVAYSAGSGGVDEDGTTHAPNPALKYLGVALFTIVAAVILLALLWITRSTIEHHLGVNLFPFAK